MQNQQLSNNLQRLLKEQGLQVSPVFQGATNGEQPDLHGVKIDNAVREETVTALQAAIPEAFKELASANRRLPHGPETRINRLSERTMTRE